MADFPRVPKIHQTWFGLARSELKTRAGVERQAGGRVLTAENISVNWLALINK